MAACGTLHHIFDNLPIDPPKPLVSCKHVIPVNPLDNSPTDVFSGFDINEKTESIPSSRDHDSKRLSGALGLIFDNLPKDPPKPLVSCKPVIPVNPLDNSPTDVFSGFDVNEKTESIPSSPGHDSERLSEALGLIFDNLLKDPPKPLVSCKPVISVNPLDNSPTDVFSGFDINEKTESIPSSPDHDSERLSEALGFRRFDQWEERCEYTIKHVKTGVLSLPKRSRISGKVIPPPISSIGRRVCFKSYRFNGRLVVKEEKIPTQDILHAFREDGRLKLRFIRFDDNMEERD